MSPTPTSRRDESQDRAESRTPKHQHSQSEAGRSSIPMWDSSDPDRAPPPLPLNPNLTNSPISKPYASSNIEKAAALIAARALENTPSAYTSNPLPSSPDKNMSKAPHRRMQSVQDGSVGRLSDSLERRSPDKGLRASKLAQFEDFRSSRSPDRSPTRTNSETPTPAARSQKLDFDENTPPSSDMLALSWPRDRRPSESALGDITNLPATAGQQVSFDALSTQILNITNIATNLQKEMSNLSIRSKDNASDLLGLREATNSRDEDIRRSLRDLMAGLDKKFGSIDSRLLGPPEASRSTPNLALCLDDKEHTTPTRKSFNLPRIASPAGFLDRELTASPSVVSVDGAASIALLEKVLREMATKEGQDRLLGTLEAVKVQAGTAQTAVTSSSKSNPNPHMMQKLEEILGFLKEMKATTNSQALVRANGSENRQSSSQMDLYLDGDHRTLARSTSTKEANDEMAKTLRSVKQSLAQHGGLTNEVKALVRELRGEVLGMGREIARKLDKSGTSTREPEPRPGGPDQSVVVQVVEQGVADLKEHIHFVVQESLDQSQKSAPSVDTAEIVNAVHKVLANMPRQECSRDAQAEREYLLSAVREAWEECKPEIALEHFGLERDEILDTLKEGLQSYQPQNVSSENVGATYEEVLHAIKQGLSDFQPPQLPMQPGASKDEVLDAVRECLDGFDFPMPRAAPTESCLSDMSRDLVMDAVREVFSAHTQSNHLTKGEILETVRDGLSHQAPSVTKEIEFNREDLFDAIRACLEGEQNPMGGMGERVVEAMHEFLGSMKDEFQQYSAANGRDTEQVLDAIKDGLEDLRAEVESYVDRASDVTGKDEIIDTIKSGFAAMQADMDKGFSTNGQKSMNTPDLLDAMEKEFEHLRESIRKTATSASGSSDRGEILDAIRDLSDDRQSSLSSNSEDVVRLVKEELEHMRTTLATTLVKGGSSLDRDEVLDVIREGLDNHRSVPRADGNESILSNTSELLDAFQDGVDNIRADMQKLIDKPMEFNANAEILDSMKTGIENIRDEINQFKSRGTFDTESETGRSRQVVLHDDNAINTQLEALKVMITQLRIKVEAIDIPLPEANLPSEMRMHREDLDDIYAAMHHHARKEDLSDIHASLREMQESVSSIPREVPHISLPEVVMPTNAVTKDDTDAIETILFNVKAKLDDVVMPGVESAAKTSHLQSIEDLLREVKSVVDASTSQGRSQSSLEDYTMIELLLKDVSSSIEGLEKKMGSSSKTEDTASKTDLEVLESLCLDIKMKLDEPRSPETEFLATKEDISDVKDSIKAFREQIESDNDLTAQAFEARKIEHGGLASRIEDVKTIMSEIREELVSRLNGSEEGIVELSKVLGMHHDHMSTYATAASITELSELVNKTFESHVGSKDEIDERDATLFSKHDETTQELKAKIDEKFTELMTKYDDAQISNDAKMNNFEARDKTSAESVAGVKSVVDELKGLMNTLGATVSETCDKISSDSRTVFDIVDQSHNKIGDLQTSNADEHVLTRDDIAKTLAATERLEASLHVNQPAILAAIREVLERVGQHYEHSQQQTENFIKATEEIKTGVNAIPEAIPPLLPALPPADTTSSIRNMPDTQGDDDAGVHVKLDELVAHSALAKEAFASMDAHHTNAQERLASLEKLDGIHEKVTTTAEEISAMVATQVRLMNEHHDSRAVEAREAAIALEKRTAQKELVEADIFRLSQEKNSLVESMAALRREHEELNAQTKRLTRDVAKLETALSIRQEEMRTMNARAESLERRVLEGVMNHARSAKLTKPLSKKKISPAERDASMNLKRVSSTASNATAKASSKAPSSMGNTLGMALKKRTPLGDSKNGKSLARASTVDRRIASTSHMPGSRQSDANRAIILAPVQTSGLMSLKRSQSVKSNPSTCFSGRKPSWTGIESTIADKENHSTTGDEGTDLHDDEDDNSSDTGTERRTSFSGTSYMYSDSSISRSSRRSTSYASSLNGTINGHGPESIAEEDENDNDVNDSILESQTHDSNAMVLACPMEYFPAIKSDELGADQEEKVEEVDVVPDLPTHFEVHQHEAKFAVASDSGIGSEPPTPDQSHNGWQSAIST